MQRNSCFFYVTSNGGTNQNACDIHLVFWTEQLSISRAWLRIFLYFYLMTDVLDMHFHIVLSFFHVQSFLLSCLWWSFIRTCICVHVDVLQYFTLVQSHFYNSKYMYMIVFDVCRFMYTSVFFVHAMIMVALCTFDKLYNFWWWFSEEHVTRDDTESSVIFTWRKLKNR